MAASTASACLRRLSPFVYSHNNSQASARSGMSGSCSTSHKKAQDKVSHKKAHKAHNDFLCAFCAFLWLLCSCREVAWAGANRHVLASGCYLNLAIAVVAVFVELIIAKHVLRAKLGGDLSKSIRKRSESVGAQQPPTRFLS